MPFRVLLALLLAAPLSAQSADTARVPLVPRPAVVRGLYVNRWAAMGKKMWDLIDLAKRTEVNALVREILRSGQFQADLAAARAELTSGRTEAE